LVSYKPFQDFRGHDQNLKTHSFTYKHSVKDRESVFNDPCVKGLSLIFVSLSFVFFFCHPLRFWSEKN
jgi:hypothetical protein